MAAQFPNDEINGMMRPVVHIWSARLDVENRLKLTTLGTALLRDVGSKMPGFVRGQVFESDDARMKKSIKWWRPSNGAQRLPTLSVIQWERSSQPRPNTLAALRY
jgi:hypothetical protein